MRSIRRSAVRADASWDSVISTPRPIIADSLRSPMRRLLLSLCFAALAAAPAAAHPAPFSYVDVRLDGAAIDVTVTVHEFDVAHDLGIQDASRLLDAAELARHSAALIALLRDRLQIWVSGARLDGDWSAA